jgi:hypothetical protein
VSPRRRRRLPAAPAPLVLPLPTAWARERIAAGRAVGELPDYGSPAWHELADDDPRKVAAALVAAEVHRYEVATLADRLARELAELRAIAERERAEALDAHGRRVAEAAAAQVLGRRPSAAELARRRGEPAAAERIEAQRQRVAAYLAAHPWPRARRASA